MTGKTDNTWDPFVRIFHWSLVVFFFLAYWLEGGWLPLHSHAGYTVTLLVVFRLVWGFVGPRHARFADFVAGPRHTFDYLGQLLRRKPPRYAGHDPAGGAMILLLIASVLVTTFSGMSLFAMEGFGPLAGTFVVDWRGGIVEDIHEVAANFTVGLIVVHVIGVLATSLLHRQNLIGAMVTGRKRD
jgi:cytochrome b